jgi:hypothetical protein
MKTFTIFWGDEEPKEIDDWSMTDRFKTPDGSFVFVNPSAKEGRYWFIVRAGMPRAVDASAVPNKYRTHVLLLQ